MSSGRNGHYCGSAGLSCTQQGSLQVRGGGGGGGGDGNGGGWSVTSQGFGPSPFPAVDSFLRSVLWFLLCVLDGFSYVCVCRHFLWVLLHDTSVCFGFLCLVYTYG